MSAGGARRRDAGATREAILEAAKVQFARLGYDRAALRAIAAEAGVDVALVHRYFGGKDGLFTEALKASFQPGMLQRWSRDTLPRDVAGMMADNTFADDGSVDRFQFLLRAAASPTTAPMLSRAIQERFLGPIRDWLGGEDAMARARVFASIYIGCLVERLLRDEPLAGREREVYIDLVSASLDRVVMHPAAD